MSEINLVLSGGGARGIAHLGVMRALLDHDLEIKQISGVSSGAITGAFYAQGMSPEEILEVAVEHSYFNPRRFNLGFYSKNNMHKILEKYFFNNPFTSLKIPLYAAATNINSGKTEYFCSGPLVPALVASCALSVLFPPIEIHGSQYLDGGLLNNLPVEPFLQDKIPVIGVHVNPIAKQGHFSSTLKIIERSIELSIYKNIRARKKYCDLFVEPPELRQFSIFDFAKAGDIFKLGYDYASKRLEKFLKTGKESMVSTLQSKTIATH